MSIVNWIGGSSNRFSDAANWSPKVIPNSTSDVKIAPAAATTVNVTNATINSLSDSANVTLAIAATDSMTIIGAADAANPTGASLNAGAIKLGSAADLFLDGGFRNSGSLSTAAASDVWISGAFANAGKVAQNGDFTLGNATHAGTATNAVGASWSISGAVDILVGPAAGSRLVNAGTLTRGGAGVTDIGAVTINRGSIGETSGQLEFLAGVLNGGVMSTTAGSLWLDNAVGGTGTLDIGAGGALHVVRGADAGQTVDFLGTGTLDLHTPATFAGHIADFGKTAGDLIDLVSKIATSETFSGGVLTLFNGATQIAHLNFTGAGYSTSTFSLSTDGHSGTLVHFV